MTLELSPQAYEKLIEHTVDLLTIVDEKGIIKYESGSIENLLGYGREELIGENAFEYIHPEDQQNAFETFSEVIEAEEQYTTGSIDFRFRHKDGSWVWLEGKGSNQTVAAVGGYVISSRDISARKESEQQLRRERDRLQRFSSVISHDLRNPLNVALGRLELIQKKNESDHLDALERSLNRMDEMIEDVLKLEREGNGKPAIDAVDLQEAVASCWDHVDTKAATLKNEANEVILADKSRLQNLLENLIRNAIEHGGEEVIITIGSLTDGFFVEDDGQGISEDNRTSLLDYGFSTKSEGTGLGLSIVNEVVQSHGWSLRVTNGENGGARFEITEVEIHG